MCCSAAEFDRAPLLKALVTRNTDVHARMPADVHSVIATFMGSELRTHFVPSRVLPHSVHAAVLTMYRFPVRCGTSSNSKQYSWIKKQVVHQSMS